MFMMMMMMIVPFALEVFLCLWLSCEDYKSSACIILWSSYVTDAPIILLVTSSLIYSVSELVTLTIMQSMDLFDIHTRL